MIDDIDKTVLLLVDIQMDFLPGGALEVPKGDEIIGPVGELMRSDMYRHCVATQDWHPPGHASFASNHPGHRPMDVVELHGHDQTLWPDHCIQGTKGAKLCPELPWERVQAVIRKGMDPDCDSYSAFRNNWDHTGKRLPTGLTGFLREQGLEHVFICGLARDVCVKWTAEDAVGAGFDTNVIWDLTRPVDPTSNENIREALIGRGIGIVESVVLTRCEYGP